MVPPPGCHYEYEYHFEHDRDLIYGTEYIDEHVAHYFTNGLVRYVMQDANYNAVGYVNEVEALVYQFSYHPYGQFLEIENGSGADISNPGMFAQFQGLMLDRETGMYNSRSRIYWPEIMRFLQRDPNGQSVALSAASWHGEEQDPSFDLSIRSQYTDGLSLYESYNSNPGIGRDPEGLSVIDDVTGLKFDDKDFADDLLLRRDWDDIYDSFFGDTFAFLGAQGAGTFGGYWGGNVTALPKGAHKAAGVSEGFSQYADFYADQMMYLPVEGALAGMGAFGSMAALGQAGRAAREGNRLARVSGLVRAADAARFFRIPWGRFRHILGRHAAGTSFTGVGRFAKGANIQGMIRQALRSDRSLIRPNRNRRIGGWLFDLDFGRRIGLAAGGGSSTVLRVILRESGRVWTAYPI